ncbi:MAG: hypothetical protein GY862_19955 [Gammaproteobacteria bacterium]|nr:hypothetical protein [Gammaproteobacteria bacterium]
MANKVEHRVMNILRIKVDDLIHARSVESVRREFKKSWSEHTFDQVIRTVCAFANDFFNLNGGYIIIGVAEQDGIPVLPPVGLNQSELDKIQKEIRGGCNRITPDYMPLLAPVTCQNRHLLVIWCPPGDLRPYQAPKEHKNKNNKERCHYVRQGSETIIAKGDILFQLMQMTARVPFDDRRSLREEATLDTLSPTLVRNFLNDVKSRLFYPEVNDYELYREMDLTARVNGHEVPKNIALLFFCNEPGKYFPKVQIDVVQFADGEGGDLIEEKIFRGPLHVQLREALNHLNNLSTVLIQKLPAQAEAMRTVAFPYQAMEEAIVNAVYHRDYEYVYEPVKVYLYPDRMEIISYPGPAPGLCLKHFKTGKSVPQVPNRNRRIGEFLKELSFAESRNTGIPIIWRKMRENGSPEPEFEFDEETRTYFKVTLPAHPQYVVLHALRESALLWTQGERQRAVANLQSARQAANSGGLTAQLIEYHAALGELSEAQRLFGEAAQNPVIAGRHQAYLSWSKVLLDRGEMAQAVKVLKDAPSPEKTDELIELALLHKRARQFQQAHSIFSANYDLLKDNPKAVHEYAQTKNQLAGKNRDRYVRKHLNEDAAELLRRAIQLSDDHIRNAWCWSDLARTLTWLNRPGTEITQAYQEAMRLLPDERRFTEFYRLWQQQRKKRRN